MSISKHAVYNVAGALFPSVLTLVTIPLYLSVIGIERYGVLTLCWVMLGYTGILDVGLGLAAARKIAELRDGDGNGDADAIFWTAAWISLLIGLAGAVLMYVGASLYFRTFSEAGSPLRAELAHAAPVLAVVVPLVMVSGVIKGALQGREKFLLLNAAGTIGSALSVCLPLATAYFWSSDISLLVATLFVPPLLLMPWLYSVCRRVVPLGMPKRPSRTRARELVSFGGWVSMILVANNVIQTFDRLLIGSRLGAAAVPTYAIPYGLVSRIVLIPHSLSGALFPRFAYADQAERERLTCSSIKAVVAIITPALIGLIAVAEPFFQIWIGDELAEALPPIAYALAGGFWIYCIGHMAYSMLQATGRPDLVAKVLFAELVPYTLLLVIGMSLYGVLGAALAFTARAVVDCIIFLFLAKVPWRIVRWLALPAALTLSAIIVASALDGPARYTALAVLVAASVVWSLPNLPDSFRFYLDKLSSLLPSTRRG